MKYSILLLTISLLAACEAEQQVQPPPAEAPPPSAPAIEIAAEVNGEVISRAEVDQMALDMFGDYQAAAMDDAARRKLLDSMVSSLLLAQQALAELPEAERARIENKTRRYRENLLVSEYLRLHMTPEPITETMIQDYYNRNLAQFGQSELRRYQLLRTRQPLSVDQRNAFLRKLGELEAETSLQAMQQKFNASGFDTAYQTGVAEPGLLSNRLQQIIDGLAPGRRSDLHYVDDIAYLIQVDEILQRSAKPLSQVRDSIRKTLAMAQLKQAVGDLSVSARKDATVTLY